MLQLTTTLQPKASNASCCLLLYIYIYIYFYIVWPFVARHLRPSSLILYFLCLYIFSIYIHSLYIYIESTFT